MARTFVRASSQYGTAGAGVGSGIGGYPLTMACWVRASSLPGTMTAFSLNAGGNYLALGLLASGAAFSEFSNGGLIDSLGSTTTSAGALHHIAVTASGSIPANWNIWLDGANDGTGSGSTLAFTGNEWGIGCINPSATPGSFFQGDVAECAAWNVVLGAADLAMLALGVSPLLVQPSALVFYAPIMGDASPERELVGRRELTLTNSPASAPHPRIFKPTATKRQPRKAGGGSTPQNLTMSTAAIVFTGNAAAVNAPTTLALGSAGLVVTANPVLVSAPTLLSLGSAAIQFSESNLVSAPAAVVPAATGLIVSSSAAVTFPGGASPVSSRLPLIGVGQ